MNSFQEYQAFTESLAAYNESGQLYPAAGDPMPMPWLYPALALAEEAGEVAGKVAKFVRKSKDFTDNTTADIAGVQLRIDVAKELGDVLYQLSETARQFGLTLEEVAYGNVMKLSDRKERGVIVGEGDNR